MYNEFATYKKDEDILVMEEKLTRLTTLKCSAQKNWRSIDKFSSVNRRDNIVKEWMIALYCGKSSCTLIQVRLPRKQFEYVIVLLLRPRLWNRDKKFSETPKSRGTYRQYTCGQQKSYLT